MSPKLTDDKLVLSWASDEDPNTLDQARKTAALPFVVKPLALMPDAHIGKGPWSRCRLRWKTWNSHDAVALLDEHPDSYKDIDQVMTDQQDLVRPLHILRQVLNYKGT